MRRQTRISNRLVSAFVRCATLLCVSAVSVFGVSVAAIPDRIAVRTSDADGISVSLPFVSISARDISCGTGGREEYDAQARVMGLPVKDVSVSVYDDNLTLYPGGMTFGIRMSTHGVVVVGISEVECTGGARAPAIDAGFCVGDVITKAGERQVNTVDEVTSCIAQSDGKAIDFTVVRDDKECTLKLTPVYSESDGFYRAGLWIRDGTAGIGTVTYINPEDLSFGGLGHGVCDADTGELMPLGSGTVFSVTVNGIVRGENGAPGELKGYFNAGKTGVLTSNGKTGVYGVFAAKPEVDMQPVKIALHDEVKSGPAVIRCSLGDGKIEEYEVTLEKMPNQSEEKNLVVRVTDKRLLEKTGGIIQGMSGSPILQDGRLVGAITHVLINDPTCGYGIFIENMLTNQK